MIQARRGGLACSTAKKVHASPHTVPSLSLSLPLFVVVVVVVVVVDVVDVVY